MIFKNFPIIITKKDSDGPHYAFCKDLNFTCEIHEMTLPEACGAAKCLVQQYCNYLSYQGKPLPDATPVSTARKQAPDNALIVTVALIAEKEEGDPNY